MTQSQSARLALLLLLATAAASQAHSSRPASMFEPLFAHEETDTHTVTAGARGGRLAPELGGSTRNSDLPPRVDDEPQGQERPSAAPALSATRKAELLEKLQSTSGELRKAASAKRQIESFVSAQAKEAGQSTTSVRRRPTTEPPRHWSALENYYERLRHSAAAKSQYGQPLNSEENALLDQLVQEVVSDNSLRYQPIYRGGESNGAPAKTVIASAVPQPLQPFGFPLASHAPRDFGAGSGSDHLQAGQQQQPIRYNFDHSAVTPTKEIVPRQQVVQVEVRPSTYAQHTQQALGWPSTSRADGPSQADNELRKFAELLLAQQQLQRAKHQQETFGELFDERRAREQQQEEASCGPRNQPLSQAAPLEFPSHMGLYNGTQMRDEDFLCAAVWLHERFALTLASCITGLQPNATLTVRAGEWTLNRSWPNASATLVKEYQRATMVARPVSRLHLFPRYQVNSSEHNLVLLEWSKPVDFMEMPYGVPACQLQPRSSLRATSCWAPGRNVTSVEWFDAEGEGETKLRRAVKMVAVGVQLHASDEPECQRQTGAEFFNFNHPNYICSDDSRRRPSWRAKLNTTDYFGSGVYCNEGGTLNLVSILHPAVPGSPSTFGYMDLSYYRPWMRSVILGRGY